MSWFTGKVAKFGGTGRKIIEIPKCIRDNLKPGEEATVYYKEKKNKEVIE